jgi:hypothetical protein
MPSLSSGEHRAAHFFRQTLVIMYVPGDSADFLSGSPSWPTLLVTRAGELDEEGTVLVSLIFADFLGSHRG